MTKRMIAIGLIVVAMAGVPAAAGAGGATLYELTENMRLDNLSAPTLRTASRARPRRTRRRTAAAASRRA